MINGKKVYCILTLRENSQRIINKCFKIFNGKSLFETIFNVCKQSKYIDKIYISTSSKNYIKQIKEKKYKCKIIYRPQRLSTDKITLPEVIKYAGKQIQAKDNDYVIWVDITKPLTKTQDIDIGIETINLLNYDTLFTIKKFDGFLMTDPPVNSQDLPDRYLRFSMYRIFLYGALKEIDTKKNGWGQGVKHLDLPIAQRWYIDINNGYDFISAEALIKAGY